jgi:hypothetical protein
MPRSVTLMLFLVGACGSGSPPLDHPSSDAAPADAGLARDLGASDGASPADAAAGSDATMGFDAAGADLAPDPTQPHPPAGATKCGGSSFTTADSKMVCSQSTLPDINGQPLPRACDAVTFASGTFEVWCTSKTAYAFFHISSLKASGTLVGCMGVTDLFLEAEDRVTIVGGSMGGTLVNYMSSGDLTNAWVGVSGYYVDINMPLDVYAWLTMDRSSTGATVYLKGFTFSVGMCGSKAYAIAGATATWM